MTTAPAGQGHDSGRYSPGYASTSGNGTRSLSPQHQHQQQEQPYHRRGYQACDPCRKRKVKCDLGSVDNPRPPPCVRCRRESKRCEFSATRRKRKPSEVEETVDGVLRRDKRMMMADATAMATATATATATGSNNESSEDVSPFDADRHKWSDRRSSVASSQTSPAGNFTSTAGNTSATTAAGVNAGVNAAAAPRQTLYGPGYSAERTTGPRYGLEGGPPMMNRTAVELLSPAISNSHDALHLLSEAAGRTEDLNRQSLENRYASRQSASTFNSPASSLAQAGTPRRTGSGSGSGSGAGAGAGSGASAGSGVGVGVGGTGGTGSAGSSFPRTSHSGSMSMGNGYQHGGASGGSMGHMSGNRGHGDDAGFVDAVKAWSRLRFVRAGWLTVEEAMDYIAYYYENLAPLSPIVVPDYSHPSSHRALLTDEPVLAVTILTTSSRHMKPKGDGSYTRSFYIHDRLWSYLRGMIERLFWGQEKFGAHGVDSSKPRAFELASASAKMNHHKGNLRSLGTVEALLLLTDWHPRNLHFPPGDDENALLDLDAQSHGHDGEHMTNKTSSSSTNAGEGRLAFHKWLEPAWRSDRMSWMLLSTAQALAFELGVFDHKSESKAANEPPAEQTRKRRLRRLILVYVTQSSGRLGIPTMLPLPQYADDIQPTSPADLSLGDSNIDRMHDCWIGISKLMYQSNQMLFASSEQTSELIRSGRYQDQINQFQPHMREWRQNIDTIDIAPAMRHILMIEYEYTRLYVNSLALQAVVDRWTTMSNEAAQAQNRQTGNSWFGVLMEIYRVNEPYIQEVVDASRRILQIVLDGLVPGDHLKHTPVRSCFRILSGMIFILKTFTLGAKEDDVRVSLDLQDRVVEALRTNVVDDVHLNHAISRLLELLTTNIRTRFLRFAPTDRGADGENSHDLSRQESPTRGRRDEPNTNSNTNNNAWPTAQAQSLGFMDGNGTSMADPLAGIPAQPINSSNINVSFMPPPPSVYYNYYDTHATPASGTGNAGGAGGAATAAGAGTGAGSLGSGGAAAGGGGNGDLGSPNVSMPENTGANALPDWFALPLDQFINSSTTTVDQGLGGTGPMLGEFDMLEVLLNEQHDGNQGDGVDDGLSSHLL